MTKPPATISFATTIVGSATKTGIAVPIHVIEKLDAGQRPAVKVEVNDAFGRPDFILFVVAFRLERDV